MKSFEEMQMEPNFGYEISPLDAEELGAFEEKALSQKDAEEGVEDQG